MFYFPFNKTNLLLNHEFNVFLIEEKIKVLPGAMVFIYFAYCFFLFVMELEKNINDSTPRPPFTCSDL